MTPGSFDLEVSGFPLSAKLSGAAEERLLGALIDRLFAMRAAGDGRLVAFLVGPPGCGKSTLSLILERLAGARAPGVLQALPMDGFHHAAAYIRSHTVTRDSEVLPMARVKGSPESFDAEKLGAAIRTLKDGPLGWPAYDRRLHDVVEGAIKVTGGILLVEGNWLLLDEPGFFTLRDECDYAVALWADEALLKGRLIARKIRGGASEEAAWAHCEACDLPNIRRYLQNSRPGDMNLCVLGDGAFEAM